MATRSELLQLADLVSQVHDGRMTATEVILRRAAGPGEFPQWTAAEWDAISRGARMTSTGTEVRFCQEAAAAVLRKYVESRVVERNALPAAPSDEGRATRNATCG
jgi:hypothetical protein